MADTDEAPDASSREGQEPEDGGSKKRVVALGVLVLIAVAIAGILWLRPFSDSDTEATDIEGEAIAAAVSVEGEALPAFESVSDPSADPAVGMPAPALEGTGLDGEPLTIEPDDGTPRALVFLAHWCDVCQEQLSVLQQAVAEGELRDDVRLVAISTGARQGEANYPPGPWFREQGWQVPTLVDSEDRNAAAIYGLRAYPYWVFTTGQGTVVGRLDELLTVDGLGQLMEELATREAETSQR